MLAGDGFLVKVGHGRTVVDLAEAVDGSGAKEHRGDKLGLAAPAVTDDGHIADARCVVDLHMG